MDERSLDILGAMRKHTTVNLDRELVREAAEILGTSSIIGTVHAALAQVVLRDKRAVAQSGVASRPSCPRRRTVRPVTRSRRP